jgi:hypothetical protein
MTVRDCPGMIPTPAARTTIRELPIGGAIIASASHSSMPPVHLPTLLRDLSWRKFCAGLVLPLLLVFMQHAALLHELRHLTGQETQEAGDKQGTHSRVCLQCVAFAQAGSGVAASSVPPALLAGLSFEMPLTPDVAVGAITPPAHRSRGPPTSA